MHARYFFKLLASCVRIISIQWAAFVGWVPLETDDSSDLNTLRFHGTQKLLGQALSRFGVA